MGDEALTEEQAAERLSHYLLKEAYHDLAAVLLSANAKAAESLFYAIEKRTADALRAIVSDRTEGAASTRIARTVGGELHELFAGAHGRTAAAPQQVA
ncbi:hypothetical protein NS228_19300 [Methylobacterium indicum]|uniref:Uncharacterized protein n=1 Tax=Methylobacterium indicum TaxID=1775910 RepID=A0A0J6TGP7_9HYPH|nr:hypothetical protein [Methylobacterium indicum]KMO11411.1 hypothetical protein QR78_28505 [Methylobacterium indicum]KMO26382.1 hypothetical protein QR79_02700 [Methylobacterium indicum]KTS24487.1 hypothetical protein NS229_21965 [Methylobacterium indicum]KTS37285.1 hypothetical protein NS228_19300 [Methylobacterium indicum]KTS43741.1 hypothetical protein NS230_26405 [Methylobacterium indicum]